MRARDPRDQIFGYLSTAEWLDRLDTEFGHTFPSVERIEMHNEFMAIIERDGEWHIAYCPQVPGANGQGKTKDEARESLAQAVALILEDRREDGLRGVPPDAVRETITIS